MGEVCNNSRLIVENLPYIERQCRRAVARNCQTDSDFNGASPSHSFDYNGISLDNEADELLNEVLDRLKADNFKALREFRGKAKLTTYITTIISNLVVDIARQKKGRSRARERAEEMGEIACRLYDLVYGRGCSVEEAQNHLEVAFGIREPLESLQQMLGRMRGREKTAAWRGDHGSSWLTPGKVIRNEDTPEIIVVDPAQSAEEKLIGGQKQTMVRSVLAEVLRDLRGEEQLMIRLRFSDDGGEEPKSVREIASILGLSEKVVDTRIRRILVRMREALIGRGLALDDFI
jgi:RNA polymerase sigma factor (sigma-70 family)